MSSLREKKKELPPTTTQWKPTPSLPDDLLVSCFARVSKLYYPTLSLVSKRFCSLLSLPELYKARSLLGNTENCLYVCLQSYPHSHWFTLCRKPDQTLTNDNTSNKKKKKKKKKKKSSGYVLATVPMLPSLCLGVGHSNLVVVGSDIYSIESSSRVLILDCRSHTWHEGPSLRVKLPTLSASVVDGKIYVAGWMNVAVKNGYVLQNLSKVFDTRTQTWDHMPSIPYSEKKSHVFRSISACIDGKFHVKTDKRVVCYNSKEGKWDLAQLKMGRLSSSSSYCVIKNVLYSVLEGKLRWYDTEDDKWRTVNGLVGLRIFIHGVNVNLADYGGKMAVVWYLYNFSGDKMIWCAEIALERLKRGEIRGKVEWCNHVLTVPKGYYIVKVLAATC